MYNELHVTAIIVAGGRGTRFGADLPKQFLKIRGKTILEIACSKFEASGLVDEIVVVAPAEYLELAKYILRDTSKISSIVPGGEERYDSVINGLKEASGDIVLIHDGARPYVTEDVICRVIEAANADGACVPVVSPKDSIRTRDGNLDRSQLFMIQTPQGFRKDIIVDAYSKSISSGFTATDDGGIAEYAGYHVSMVQGDYENIKITTKEDLPEMEMRVGQGFDVHKLIEGRKCILMGVEIPYEKGLLGHSDADVALHALMDAMLGAAAMGDIGRLFPDNDPAFKDISSVKLLEEVRDKIYSAGYSIANVDVTIICERPKVSPYVDKMTAKLAKILRIDKDRINIKGTTTEHLGFTGRGEGIAAQAVCMLSR